MTPEQGRHYRHYKGGIYYVLNLGTDTETKNKVVVYKSCETNDVYVRPLESWIEQVNGEPRFQIMPILDKLYKHKVSGEYYLAFRYQDRDNELNKLIIFAKNGVYHIYEYNNWLNIFNN